MSYRLQMSAEIHDWLAESVLEEFFPGRADELRPGP